MSKLSLAYAINALEAKGYEQASNAISFLIVRGPVTIRCNVCNRDGMIEGRFVADLQYMDLNFQTRINHPLLIESDVTKAEEMILSKLADQVTYARDQARHIWETLDKSYLNAQTLLKLETSK